MAKTFFKEFFIILLICVAIILIMAVIFYNYIPTNKIIPAKVTAYKTPENIQAETIHVENFWETLASQKHCSRSKKSFFGHGALYRS